MTKPSSQTDTKNEILDLAENLLRDRGFNGFSYANISSALKIKNAAIHYYFPSKADLGVAVIQRAKERFAGWAQDQRLAAKPPAERLEAFFRRYLSFLEAEQQVCLGGALETDFKTLPSTMQVETQKFASDFLSWMEGVLDEGQGKRSFSFPGKAKDQAILILSSLQGALQMTRAIGPSCLHLAMAQILRLTRKD
jgi:TetR/AcrR family transcriptional regulator, transcriptional repressor for nem operon